MINEVNMMDNFEEYVQKYAEKHGISVEEAKTHAIVKNVKKSYGEDEKKPQLAGWKEDIK